MKNRTLLLATSLLLVSIAVSGCTPLKQKVQQLQQQSATVIEQTMPVDEQTITSSQSASVTNGTATMTASTTIELVAQNPQPGETALDLLKGSGARVEMKSYGDMGSFITSVNGMAGDAENYWAFYVNDKYAEQAADKTLLKPGDRVKFVYEKVLAAPVE